MSKKGIKNNKVKDYKLQYLTPKEDIESNLYEYIEEALNKEDVKNIAIVGPYSSGKSSVVRSYFNRKKDKKIKTVTIAMSELIYSESNTSLENIEKNLIKKLNINCSCLKLYKYSKCFASIILILIITSLLSLWISYRYETMLGNLNIRPVVFWLRIISILALCVIFIVLVLTYGLKRKNLKLKVSDFEIEVGNNEENEIKDKNIFNCNLDEIIKIMYKSEVNCVVFEDLDRFEEYEIFDHLRDLNMDLNNALEKRIIFIYEIKDDFFTPENKVKFFDILIPVTPFTSYEYSGEEVWKMLKESCEENILNKLTKEFILGICLYVSDIRILKNVVNEFIILLKDFEKIPNYQKLFAMILYKNLFPNDYYSLKESKGLMFHYLSIYKKFKKMKIDEVESDITVLKNKESVLEKREISEYIKKAFIYDVLKYNEGSTYLKGENITTFRISNSTDINDIPNDLFYGEYKIEGNKIETIHDFLERCDSELLELAENDTIMHCNKASDIQRQVTDLEKKKRTINDYSLKEIIDLDKNFFNDFKKEVEQSNEFNNEIYNKLFRYILSKGYIDETYSAYMNKFKSGSIESDDHEFIMTINDNRELPFDFKLSNPEKVILRLGEDRFNKKGILNRYILDVLLISKEYSKKREIFIKNLIKDAEYINIIDYYLKNAKSGYKKLLIQNLFELDENLYENILKTIYKDKIIVFILSRFSSSQIVNKKGFESLKEYIQGRSYLSMYNIQSIRKNIVNLNIKFTDISYIRRSSCINFLNENNCYEINENNIYWILSNFDGNPIYDIKRKCLDFVFKYDTIKRYIIENFDIFLKNVESKLEKQEDSNSTLVEIINNKNITDDNKIILMSNEENKVKFLCDIEDKELWKMLISNNFIEPIHENLEAYYKEFKIDDVIIEFLNQNYNAFEFDYNEKDKDYISDLLVTEKLSLTAFKKVLECVDSVDSDEINKIIQSESSYDKIEYIITSKKVQCNRDNFNIIYSFDIKLALECISKNKMLFSRKLSTFDFGFELISLIVKATDMTDNIKLKAIEKIELCDIEKIDSEFSSEVYNLRDKVNKSVLTEEFIVKIIESISVNMKKIIMLDENFSIISIDKVKGILNSMKEPYCYILSNRKKVKLTSNEHIISLLNKLIKCNINIQYVYSEDNIIKIRGTKR